MSQTGEKWDFLVLSRGNFWMIWKRHGIPCFHFYFLFRNNSKRKRVNEYDICHCYGNFFWKVSFQKYLITAMFSSLLCSQLFSQLSSFPTIRTGRTLTTAFERHLAIEDFTEMDHGRCQASTKTFDLLLYASLSLKQVFKFDLMLIQ